MSATEIRILLAHSHVVEVHVFVKHWSSKGFPHMIVCVRHACVVVTIDKDTLELIVVR